VIALEARGETTTDLLVNVFKGYETAQDSEFALFIKRKKDAYDEGGDITVTSLMDAAENKFKTRVLLKTWSAPTKEQEQILALTAQVHQLRIAKAAPKKDKRAPKDPSKAKQDKDQKWAWKKVLPKEGEPVTKVMDGSSLLLFLSPCPIPMFPSASSLLVLSGSNLGSSLPTPPLTTLLSS
jgi:hypothetical protein